MSDALDAWAILELLEGSEPAASRISDVLEERPAMSWINLGEVFYVVKRDQGEEEALETLRDLRPKLDLDLPSEHRVLEAAGLKADHPISYADAFAAATAVAHGATLLTGDPELLVDGAPWQWEDLRI
ncbi:MAG: PIN domain-containing protein [Actinobacteria bacterium]|nr:PIN domain-containing protein [Actinomycetota bacterium]